VEGTIQIHIEKLPEGLYLATSDDIQGLVAQGRTITETLEIARDVVKKLLESQSGNGGNVTKRR
jgi:predicted RNase H-like HicB family nuclease